MDVRLEGVRYNYGTAEAVRGVDLTLAAGEQVALLGPNGAGKTTLTRLVVGLRRPSVGRVTVGDWDVARQRPDEMARRVGYVFQHADQQLFARSIREDVAFGPRCLGAKHPDVDAVIEELGLSPLARLHPYDVPAPTRKLVALAGVLAMEPAVLVLDEPTAALDRAQRETAIAALRRRARAGVTMLAVSHDLGFVAEVADRVVVMREGRIAADRAARELLYDREALMALGLRPPATVEVSQALELPGAPVRFGEVADALRGMQWRQMPA
jgi:energy-coupling factor transport system ATP-binding protein